MEVLILAISCTLEGCTMYYGTHDIKLLDIVAMDKEGFALYFATSSIFVVEEEGYDGNHMGCVKSSSNP